MSQINYSFLYGNIPTFQNPFLQNQNQNQNQLNSKKENKINFVPHFLNQNQNENQKENQNQNENQNQKEKITHFIPSFVQLDKQVLRFFAYFEDEIKDEGIGEKRIRYCSIFYYLATQEIKIIEKIQQNSGLDQGVILSKQQVSKNYSPSFLSKKQNLITENDFQISQITKIFSREYHIFDADDFTYNYYEKKGKPLNQSIKPPKDKYTQKREELDKIRNNYSRKKFENEPNSTKFFKKNPSEEDNILVFWAVKKTVGIPCHFRIVFYLEDNTLSITEISKDSQNQNSTFLRRTTVPKRFTSFQNFSFPTKKTENEHLIPDDFVIGKNISIFGSVFFIYKCDETTKNYFRKNGFDEKDLEIEIPDEFKEIQTNKKKFNFEKKIRTFDEKKEKLDIRKFLENSGKVLRFLALIQNRETKDFEKSMKTQIIQEQLKIDNSISLYGNTFKIIDADEFTLNHISK
ncbi:ef-hand domain-containing family member c2 [Anaeramoeba ignava]|uniref:Ef-hand domain-containing family member c2 n=1 Tax=Anaeramoeba ignava TaxID=1746090 RepID=A0A9Q0REN9_ANAIG|nr:ef-hand domain-containing family member c2 [Anaeramoeba ignava]